jgi:hypothetical protein
VTRAAVYDRPRVRLRVLTTAVALVCACAFAPGRAAADPPATVAVIPLQADARLALYGHPVASELAGALRTAAFDVVLVSEVSVVPARAWLVVDGRLLRTGKTLAIELRIRDPERAVDVARLAVKAAGVDDIDRATRALAADLTATMERARDARAAALRAAEPVAPTPTPTPTPTPVAPVVVTPKPTPAADPRPLARVAVIGKSIVDRTGATHDVSALGTPAVRALAHRLGYRTHTGPGGEPTLTITVELIALSAGFERDVPTGRARARVRVETPQGVLWSRVVRTDTVVGSRGDRVDTLVRLVAAQITDVVAPRIRERLGSTPP